MRVHQRKRRVTDLAEIRPAGANRADKAPRCAGYFRSAASDASVSGDIIMCAG